MAMVLLDTSSVGVCDRLQANHSYTILFGMDGMVLNQS